MAIQTFNSLILSTVFDLFLLVIKFIFSNFIFFFFLKNFLMLDNKIFILSFRQLKKLSESRKKIGGFHLKKIVDDLITRK
jgi:hypothetical protein